MGRKLGSCAPFFWGGGAGSPSGTVYGLNRCIQPFGHNKHGPKIGEGRCAALGEEELGPHQHNVARAEAYLHAKCILYVFLAAYQWLSGPLLLILDEMKNEMK